MSKLEIIVPLVAITILAFIQYLLGVFYWFDFTITIVGGVFIYGIILLIRKSRET